jgi:hypothetical protein
MKPHEDEPLAKAPAIVESTSGFQVRGRGLRVARRFFS